MAEQKRWKKRPENSTWGDYGPDDQLGRMNELTAAKVKQGIAEVKEGKTFCLSMPLDYPGGNVLNPRRHPPQIRPSLRGDKPNWLYRTEWDNPGMTRRRQRRPRHHAPAVFDAVGHAGPRRRAVRCRRRRQARADLLQRLSRRHRPGRPERCQATPARCRAPSSRPRARPRPMRSASRTWRSKCLQGRGVMIDLFAHYGRKRHAVGYDDLMRVMAADGIKVEAGDFVCLRTGFDEVILGGQKEARPAHAGDQLHRPRRRRPSACSSGSPRPSWSR